MFTQNFNKQSEGLLNKPSEKPKIFWVNQNSGTEDSELRP